MASNSFNADQSPLPFTSQAEPPNTEGFSQETDKLLSNDEIESETLPAPTASEPSSKSAKQKKPQLSSDQSSKEELVSGTTHTSHADRIRRLRSTLKKHWLENLRDTESAPVFIQVLVLCNALSLNWKHPPICVRCGGEKKGELKSHIIPNTVLRYISKHHQCSQENFLRDLSGGVQKADEYKYPLLCQTCEKNLDLQCQNCGSKGRGSCRCRKEKVDYEKDLTRELEAFANQNTEIKNDKRWFARILSEIMLRGVFVSLQLKSLLEEYKEGIIALWEFAGGISTDCDLQLYLLPDYSLSEENPLELVLRAPQQTELYYKTACGSFLYAHFDFIHLVLPLDPESKNYFEKFGKDDILSETVVFNRCQYPRYHGKHNFTYMDTACCFPEVLLLINAHRYYQSLLEEEKRGDPLELTFSEDKMMSNIESLKSLCLVIKTNVPKKKSTDQSQIKQVQKREAIDHSPIAKHVRNKLDKRKKLEEELQRSEEKLQILKGQLQRSEEEQQRLDGELQRSEDELQSLNRKLRREKQDNAALITRLKTVQELKEELQSLNGKLQKEKQDDAASTTRLEEEVEKLKRELQRLEGVLENEKQGKAALQEELQREKQDKAALLEELQREKQDNAVLRSEYNQFLDNYNRLVHINVEQRETIDEQNLEVKKLKKENTEFEVSKKQLEGEKTQVSSQLALCQAKVAQLQTENTELREQNTELKESNEQLRDEEEELKYQLEQTRRENNDLRQKILTLAICTCICSIFPMIFFLYEMFLEWLNI